MFSQNAGNVTMSRGDTGKLTWLFARKDGEEFGENDKAIWTVKSPVGTVVREEIFDLDGTTNGLVKLLFRNADTDTLPLGVYSYDIRIVIEAIYDSSGRVIDGNNVITPKECDHRTITLLATVGEV